MKFLTTFVENKTKVKFSSKVKTLINYNPLYKNKLIKFQEKRHNTKLDIMPLLFNFN